MRKLMWFAVGFAAACVIGAYLVFDNLLLLFAEISLILFAGGLFIKNAIVHRVVAVLVGCAVGLLWIWGYQSVYLNPIRELDGKTVYGTVEIADYSYKTEFGVGADGKLVTGGKSYKIRIYTLGEESLRPGDTVTGAMELRFTALGGEEATYHQGNGIFLLGYADEEITISKSQQIPDRYFAAVWRKTVLNGIESVFPEDTVGFARALLLGETDKLSYASDVDFQRSGIRHVVAVSGLHIAILFSLVYLFSGRRRFLTAILGIPVLVLFAAVAGFTPSVVRACVMQGLIVLALLVNREYDPPTALATAVLVMLFANPITITSVSFQLSVGCMIGIFLFSEKIYGYFMNGKLKRWKKGKSFLARSIRWIAASVSVSVSATVITMPLSAVYFGAVSIVSMLTNILTLWIISTVFYGIMIAAALGFLWLPAGKTAAWIISWLIRYVMLIAGWISDIPFAAIYTQSVYTVAWIIFVYVLTAVFLLLPKRHPKEFACCVLASLMVSIVCSYTEPLLDDYRVTVLDVGQGQCILLQSNGRTYMVDCGGSNQTHTADTALHALYSQGITSLDGLILTHYDRDHVNGVEDMRSQIRVKNLYLPDMDTESAYKETLSQAAVPIHWIASDMILRDRDIKITLFVGAKGVDENESSMCVLFQTENCDILITGDRGIVGEAGLLNKAQLPQLELLVAGHHGSKYSTGSALLEATKPKAVAVSSDIDSYNMPAQEVLDRLAQCGANVYRTDRQGTLLFRG